LAANYWRAGRAITHTLFRTKTPRRISILNPASDLALREFRNTKSQTLLLRASNRATT
jgi:hypothetical protein